MKIPFSWLKEYVEIDITPEQLEEKLFSCGFEVEELIYLGFQDREWFIVRNVSHFLNSIQPHIITEQLYTYLSLMTSPVGIAIHGKHHISSLIHIQNPDGMLVISISRIIVVFIIIGK